jgi:enamine deaminase RidA (YjgF/YER057c/UK114 family)
VSVSLMRHKAQIYLADIADIPDCVDMWSRHHAGIPCAITVVPTKSFATVGGIIEINLIALTNGATRRKEVIDADIPGMAAFGPSLKVGEFLLPSGLMAIGPDGHVAGSEVSPAFPGLAHAGYSQAEAIYGYAEALCRAAGTTMDRLLRAQYFVTDIAAFSGISYGVVVPLRRSAAPLRLRTDPAAHAAVGRRPYRRFLDFGNVLVLHLDGARERSLLAAFAERLAPEPDNTVLEHA